ncbi:hypothetical protein EDB84DRAFT_1567117 [Lactarius hengduanensis]|nr:hypothetical protein EDB84DRAFT_1567117 [Lactarius hengduanensis]
MQEGRGVGPVFSRPFDANGWAEGDGKRDLQNWVVVRAPWQKQVVPATYADVAGTTGFRPQGPELDPSPITVSLRANSPLLPPPASLVHLFPFPCHRPPRSPREGGHTESKSPTHSVRAPSIDCRRPLRTQIWGARALPTFARARRCPPVPPFPPTSAFCAEGGHIGPLSLVRAAPFARKGLRMRARRPGPSCRRTEDSAPTPVPFGSGDACPAPRAPPRRIRERRDGAPTPPRGPRQPNPTCPALPAYAMRTDGASSPAPPTDARRGTVRPPRR